MRRPVRKVRRDRDNHRTAGPSNAITALERVRGYLFLHAHTMVASLGRMYRAPFASAMTILVIAIALALPASFQVLVRNAHRASAELEATNQVSIFLKPSIANEVGRKIAEKLRDHPQISETGLITKEAGLKEFREYSGLGDALEALDFNPLPAVINIRPKDSLARPEDVDKLLQELRAIPEADFVQVDTEWMRKLHAMLTIARRSVGGLGALLSLAVLFIVGNTIRLELQHRQEEIAVTKLMGATDGFIRRPFLYTGLWYGLLGGCGAWLLVCIMVLLLDGPVEELAELYGGHFELEFLTLKDLGLMLVFSAGLGIAGAMAVVAYHLHKLAPKAR
ncbi:MAG: cell division protein FtsX [Proteobacteria bacterium]|nr:cell division protein FtsX [Pseudomonadota bacterium]